MPTLSAIGSSSAAFNQGLSRLEDASKNMPLGKIEAMRARRVAEQQAQMEAEAKMIAAQAQRDAAGAKGDDGAAAQRSAQVIASILGDPAVFKTPEATRDAIGRLMATGDPGAIEVAQSIMGKLNELRQSQQAGAESMAGQAFGTEQELRGAQADDARANAERSRVETERMRRGALDTPTSTPNETDLKYAATYIIQASKEKTGWTYFWNKLDEVEQTQMAGKLARKVDDLKKKYIAQNNEEPEAKTVEKWMRDEARILINGEESGRGYPPEEETGTNPKGAGGSSRGRPPSGAPPAGTPSTTGLRRIGPGGSER